ncbi:hypothetical protein DL765_003460 [Monosporascus sp. GIB2]|nr:hypothetical protein DL765_003460 [Monosporascus sp. GIB2]
MLAVRAASRVVSRSEARNMSSLRTFARSFEPHPTPMPAAGPLHKGDWGRIVKTRAQQAAFYFPGLAVLLGWPLAASYVLNEHVGQF